MVASSPFLCPSRLRRSLARSRETRFTRPNRRACSQATYAHTPSLSGTSKHRAQLWYLQCLSSGWDCCANLRSWLFEGESGFPKEIGTRTTRLTCSRRACFSLCPAVSPLCLRGGGGCTHAKLICAPEQNRLLDTQASTNQSQKSELQ